MPCNDIRFDPAVRHYQLTLNAVAASAGGMRGSCSKLVLPLGARTMLHRYLARTCAGTLVPSNLYHLSNRMRLQEQVSNRRPGSIGLAASTCPGTASNSLISDLGLNARPASPCLPVTFLHRLSNGTLGVGLHTASEILETLGEV